MTPVITIAIVLIVNELTRPGDLEAGDVIALPDELGRIMIRAVRLGQGRFVLTISPIDGAGPWGRAPGHPDRSRPGAQVRPRPRPLGESAFLAGDDADLNTVRGFG